MDMFDDDDIFEISDEETGGELISSCNPVDDYLMKQLNDIQDCIARVENETSHAQSTTEKILTRLYKQCKFLDDNESSDSDDEWYDENGKPVIKRTRRCQTPHSLLTVKDIWQRVIDDKWVIGVELQNNSDRILQDSRLYIMIQGESELSGVTSLWQINDSLWNRVANLHPEAEKIAATAVLNLPNFHNTSAVTAYGTVVYHLNDKELQIPIGTIELNATQAIDKLLTPRYAQNLNASILALKAAAIEKTITISLHQEPNRGAKLLDFLESKDFVEVMPDVHMSRNPETLRNCIFEILSLVNTQIKLRISTRSTAQLNIILHMVGNEFPDAAETAREDKIIGGAIALERELQLKLECDEPSRLLNARVVTDLLVP